MSTDSPQASQSIASTSASGTDSPQKRLGDLIVELGLADIEMVEVAADIQKMGIRRKIGELLLEEGHITKGQLERVLAMQIGSSQATAAPSVKNPAEGLLMIGDILVALGFIEHEIIEGALAVQSHGIERRLGDLLVERGHVTKAQLEKALAVQAESRRKAEAGK